MKVSTPHPEVHGDLAHYPPSASSSCWVRYKDGHALDLIGTLAKMVNERLEYAMHGRVLDAVTLKRGRIISNLESEGLRIIVEKSTT